MYQHASEMKSKMDKNKFETSISELKTKSFVTAADMLNYGKYLKLL